MKFGWLKAFALGCVFPLAIALNACGDDSSTFSPTEKFPTEVKNLEELEELKCDKSIIGEKVLVESKNYLYECDGEIWFKSYDQTKPSSTSTKSSSSTKDAYSPCFNPNVSYGKVTDSRDGQVYRTVTIGTQTWMAENLNYEPRYGWSGCYNNTARYCDVYGRLYSFAAAMDSVNQGGCGLDGDCTPNIPHRGICPDGWHIPTRTEFETLLSTVGIDDSTRSVELRSNAWMLGLDDYGFSSAPSGFAYICGEEDKFLSINEETDFWSVDGSLYITDNFARWTNGNGRCYPRSIRCIKD